MQSQSSKSSNARYEPLPAAETEGVGHKETSNTWRSLFRLATLGLAFVVVLALGFFAGRHTRPSTQGGLLCKFILFPVGKETRAAAELFFIVPPGTIPEVWEHNLTFSETPSPESEDAWSSIVPGGYS